MRNEDSSATLESLIYRLSTRDYPNNITPMILSNRAGEMELHQSVRHSLCKERSHSQLTSVASIILRYSPTDTEKLSPNLHSFKPPHVCLFLSIRPQVLPVPKFFNDKEILTGNFPPPIKDTKKFFQLYQTFRADWI